MLFPDELLPRILPPGLTYVPDYLSRDQELRLIRMIGPGAWDHTYERRRKQYGGRYLGGDLAGVLPVPKWLDQLMDRVVVDGYLPLRPKGALINEYLPGQGIADHVDRASRAGGKVISISLGSGAEMRFVEPCGQRHHVYLEPRSLLLMEGDARDLWTHGISGRLTDKHMGVSVPRGRRLSITLRCGPKPV